VKRLLLATLASCILFGGPLVAQQTELEFPEYTDQQRWERLGMNASWWQSALLEMGKMNGMSPEEVGKFMAKHYSQAWAGGYEAEGALFYLRRNHLAWPGATVEVLSNTANTVTARFNRPMDTYIGDDGVFGGHSAEEMYAMRNAAELALAKFWGVTLVKEEEDGSDIVEIEANYEGINASDRMRWLRMAYLSGNTFHQLMDLKIKSGMTPEEFGAEWAEMYGPGWGSDTPWQLYRGMTWNLMTEPFTECEVLSANAEEVRARCSTAAQGLRVQQSSDYHDITLEDVLVAMRSFAEGVAEQRGLRWEETWDDEWRTIRVTSR